MKHKIHQQSTPALNLTGARDFDFLIGEWSVHNKRLTERLRGSNSWEEFDATLGVRETLNGLGNVDQFKATLNGEYFEGMTVRLFDPTTELWSIYWADTRHPILQNPMVGAFKQGKGEFFAREQFEGQEITVRFIWSGISNDTARWEQAFSPDDGVTWETNWIMNFTRKEYDITMRVSKSEKTSV